MVAPTMEFLLSACVRGVALLTCAAQNLEATSARCIVDQVLSTAMIHSIPKILKW